RKVTVGLGEGTHNWERYRERVANTGEGLPAIAWLGHHPAACMGALTRVPIDVDEYSVIGGALGEPLRLAPSETWGEKFLVPADAEIVIEGIIPPKERGRHGLRADFARYYSPETLRPVMAPARRDVSRYSSRRARSGSLGRHSTRRLALPRRETGGADGQERSFALVGLQPLSRLRADQKNRRRPGA
ncbi:MAG: UbiD family decarboxylase, partial [Deltaproteobacteria bacterium]|nr:UbiD family decarboxylase [Deltaproteobacteria bacterium]